ncbi:hypothetical protein BYI23_A014180 [Burkholderia sp. YI23]|nr:hypothetical protein BYI23_A014180 [Burkholderia sp. YI23]
MLRRFFRNTRPASLYATNRKARTDTATNEQFSPLCEKNCHAVDALRDARRPPRARVAGARIRCDSCIIGSRTVFFAARWMQSTGEKPWTMQTGTHLLSLRCHPPSRRSHAAR